MNNHEDVASSSNHQFNRQSIRERSTSAPNVNIVNQNSEINPMLEEYFNSLNSTNLTVYPHSTTGEAPNYSIQGIQSQKLSQIQQQNNIRIHSAGGSPTNSGFNNSPSYQNAIQQDQQSIRPRAKSADDSSNNKKWIVNEKCSQCPTFNNKCAACTSNTTSTANKVPIEDWEIAKEEILPGHKIGSGSFGTVYRGMIIL